MLIQEINLYKSFYNQIIHLIEGFIRIVLYIFFKINQEFYYRTDRNDIYEGDIVKSSVWIR